MVIRIMLLAILAVSTDASGIFARQASSSCVLDTLLGRVGPSAGGRKIGLVIDVSGSMSYNDPENLRLAAAKAINGALITQSGATNGQIADSVTVVDFSSGANTLYPLGDPSGADIVIGSISGSGGTAIGSGIQAAIEQLTAAGNGSAANRSGIVVFTDGQDDPASGKLLTISETQRAASLGIRISFGFLTPSSQDQDVEILRAILQSGGVYATIDQASTQNAFVALALANGLTDLDTTGANVTTTLLPGISTAKFLQTGSNTFNYAAQAGESFNISLEALDPIALQVTIRDVDTDVELATNSTDVNGLSFLSYTAQSAMNVTVAITATNGSSGIFSVGLVSSIPLNETCNVTATPTIAQPAVYTGGTTSVLHGSPNLSTALASVIGLFVVAATFGLM